MCTTACTGCARWERWVADGTEEPERGVGITGKKEGVRGGEGEGHGTHEREAKGVEERYVGFVEGAEVGGVGRVKIKAFYGGVWRGVGCGGGAAKVNCLAVGSWVRRKAEDKGEGVDFMPILVGVSYGLSS